MSCICTGQNRQKADIFVKYECDCLVYWAVQRQEPHTFIFIWSLRKLKKKTLLMPSGYFLCFWKSSQRAKYFTPNSNHIIYSQTKNKSKQNRISTMLEEERCFITVFSPSSAQTHIHTHTRKHAHTK